MMGDAKHETRAVFTAALALTVPEERARYLDEACQGKPELRQRVEVLLRAHEQAGHFLEVNGPDSDSLRESSGTVIGRYKLLEEIGEGAFGRVFMAEQIEPVHRKVALKIIKAGMDTREVIARFEAERQALALMDHPNIAKILDAGITEASVVGQASRLSAGRLAPETRTTGETPAPLLSAGRPYFVMELVRGIPITEYCDQQQLATAERLQLFMKVCAAVQHAHQKGIIHRDLKPTNILVTLIDGEAVPKVIDFGVAKALGQKLTEKTLFTAFQQMIGTPAYMSPEQAALSGVDVDTRSDIYSLGVLLYELLTGVTPFDADTFRKAALDEIRRLIRETEPPKPSTRLQALVAADVRRLTSKSEIRNPKSEMDGASSRRLLQIKETIRLLRGDLDWIVMKALEKERARRYDTASALAEDLQHHLKHEPVHAGPPGTMYRARKFIRRHRFGVAMATAVTLALAAGLTAALIGFEQASRERDRALAAEHQAATNQQKARAEATKSQQTAEFLKDMLRGVGPSVALGRDTTMLKEILDKTAERVGKELKDQPEAEVELRLTLARTYRDLGLYNQQAAMARKTIEVGRSRLGKENAAVAAALAMLGNALLMGIDPAQAEPIVRQGLAMQIELFGREHVAVAHSLDDLSHVLRELGDFPQAERVQREALDLKRKLFGEEHPEVANSLITLADLLGRRGELAEAEAMLLKALKMHRELSGSDHKWVADSLGALGAVLQKEGRLAEAESMARDAVSIRRKIYGSDHPYVIRSVDSLAEVLQREGKVTEVATLYREAAARGGAAAKNAAAWFLATSPYGALRDGRSAVGYAEQAVTTTQRRNAMYLDTLAAAYAETGQFTNAVNVQKEAIALRQNEEQKQDYASRLRLYESGFPYRDDDSLARHVSALLGDGKSADAEPVARECLAIRENQIPDAWKTFNARSMLGGCLLGQKKYAEAEPLLLSGYEGMKQREAKIPAAGKPRLKESLQRLVQLYDATGRPDQAAAWRQKLAAFEKADSAKPSAAPPR